ncbi:NADH dehydrogenase [ubiquinone] iron-sulfur protein 6, mitochondrial-like [Mercenaria mercenaria]|uniref:NADH dehydrogenase [ubiquinone] iron-sulfur protein 6, mitochondrial-like n=1 Tax=Mercenaria mercenaria TaxID=6596 RepID=UPI001E1DC347|nr:NADH dehydrogenase [ubiquinone] iron-sulfur protein 6, mitochondrial-like [Mercenaria mercenaria]
MATIVRGLSRLPGKHQVFRALSTSSCKCIGEGPNVDKVTHTGQVWDKDDFRRTRFVGKDKLVNTQFSIDLIAEDPIVVCERRKVASNSGGALGHPKVFINLDRPEVAVCGYSGRKFIQKKFYNAKEHGPSITYEEYLAEMESIKS